MGEIVQLGASPTTFVAAGLMSLTFAGGAASPVTATPYFPVRAIQRQSVGSADHTFSPFGDTRAFKVIPPAFADAYREMLSFKELGAGWDGVGSEKLSDSSVNGALAFLALLPGDVTPPDASASADGTVDWYWRNGHHAATVTFHPNGRVAYYVLTGEGTAKNTFELSDSIPGELLESLRRL